ncbi:hypothetical protein [Nocardiopsis potens]|uniref:hypothetical protein n=1 Tax=Nocardiopsis potens TaxID=1246458 RepID=UPI00037A7EC4|nr:hypothetical protein [Nocardiopsis potens]
MDHPEEMEAVARRVGPGTALDGPVPALARFISAGKESGAFVDADEAVIANVLQAVLLLPVNAERLASPEHYPQTLDLLIDIVAAGLTRKDGET